MSAVLLAPAKLTLSLRVVGVRDDGFHLIDAEMVTVDLADRLTIDPGDGLEVLGVDGGPEVDDGDDNLVRRALALAGRTAQVRVEKAIPAGAGLGGGSADAAAVLRWAGFDDLVAASAIGADVAFCLVGGRARVGCPTPAVYRRWDEMGGPSGGRGNDLEQAAVDLVPDLARWRDSLAEASGLQPRLAGSGSTWFVEGEFPGGGRRVVRTLPPTVPLA